MTMSQEQIATTKKTSRRVKHKSSRKKPKQVTRSKPEKVVQTEKISQTEIPVSSGKKSRGEFKKLEEEGIKAAKTDEVEELIGQLNKMSLNNPTYPALHYRLGVLDPAAQNMVAEPDVRHIRSAPSGAPLGAPPDGMRRREDMMCFRCGDKGHSISACPRINEFVLKGVIIRDYTGKLVMKDGSRIVRINQEPFIQAIERMLQPKSNFVTLAAGVSRYHNMIYPSDISESKDEMTPWTHMLLRGHHWLDLVLRKEPGIKSIPSPRHVFLESMLSQHRS